MTITDVSTGNKDTVSPFLKTFKNKIGIYPSCAHHTNDTQIGGILKPTDTSKICCRIGAPVAGKRYYFWIKFPGHPFFLVYSFFFARPESITTS
jgi:hypothetical protein